MRTVLLVAAIILFLVGGVSAAGWWLKEANPVAVIAFGLAAWAAAPALPERWG